MKRFISANSVLVKLQAHTHIPPFTHVVLQEIQSAAVAA